MDRLTAFSLIASLCFLILKSQGHERECTFSDYASLRAFQASVETRLPWRNATNCCSWLGIRCNRDGYVVSVNLTSMGLSGLLTPHLSYLSALSVLDLSRNSLSGRIPIHFRNLSNLKTLNFSHNPLITGGFPSQLSSSIEILDLSHCSLHGPISDSLSNLSSLYELYINHNLFTSFPHSIACPEHLTVIDASYNFINGSVDGTVFNGARLQRLYLAYNSIAGVIPRQISHASRLEILDLRGNYLMGDIPSYMSKFKNLKQIWLDDNAFSGSLPGALEQLLQLNLLSVSNNMLLGPFPVGILNCSSLLVLSLSRNRLFGEIPSSLGNLSCLQVLLLNDNQFSGNLPPRLTQLSHLRVLDLSHNRLKCPLPQETGGTVCVIIMSHDACRKDQVSDVLLFTRLHPTCLSGPNQYKLKLTPVAHMKQTFAQLIIPDHLCIITMYSLQRELYMGFLSKRSMYTTDAHPHKGLSPIIIGIITGIGVFITGILLIIVLKVLCSSKIRTALTGKFLAPAKMPSLRRFCRETSHVFDPRIESISMRDLMKLTDNFDNSRIIGDGGFGLVFSATLQDGRTVAVKKLAEDGLQGKREFEAEMDTLGMIRHPNLVELLAYCKLGDERVLVYEFAENGSLDTWLHERDDGPMVLHWQRRLNIAKGSACGLAYLHHDCNPHVIHRDIKSSNILLNKEFEPKIADFGLARNMSPLVSHVSTVAAGTFGYMAPEYSMCRMATLKADVYSFGMLMLEIAIRRRPNELIKERNGRTIAYWARQMLKETHVMELLDPALKKGKLPPLDHVALYFSIASDCISEIPAERPTMREVFDRLSFICLPKIDSVDQIPY